MRRSLFFALLGLTLGLGAPAGSLCLRWLMSPLPFGELLGREWTAQGFFYTYMLTGTCLAFSLFGWALGLNADSLLHRNIELRDEVLTDPLTGLGNHRFLHDTFKIEFRQHKKTRLPISCLMLDLDHFKHINDTYGHPFGDHVLKHFSMILKKNIRSGDTAARYGGEEFLCILPNCSEEEVRAVAERIRKATESHAFQYKRELVKLTVSLGAVTSYESSGLNYRQLIALSDRTLYDAKHKGRNQLVQTALTMRKKFERK